MSLSSILLLKYLLLRSRVLVDRTENLMTGITRWFVCKRQLHAIAPHEKAFPNWRQTRFADFVKSFTRRRFDRRCLRTQTFNVAMYIKNVLRV